MPKSIRAAGFFLLVATLRAVEFAPGFSDPTEVGRLAEPHNRFLQTLCRALQLQFGIIHGENNIGECKRKFDLVAARHVRGGADL